jgi:hypothetical protein
MRSGSAIIVAFIVACGGGKPRPIGGGTVEAPVDAGPPAAGCPASWGEVPAGAACEYAGSPSMCNYDEGSCYCGVAQVCSGAAIDETALASQPTSWNCTAKPPLVRPDGCPGEMNDGLACDEAGKLCSYGSCCVTITECRDGQWRTVDQECPP